MLPQTQKVVFKGVRDGILVIIDADAELGELMDCLAERARLGRDFFAGATAILDIRVGELSETALKEISEYLVSEMGFGSVRVATSPYLQSVRLDILEIGSTDDASDPRTEDLQMFSAATSADATMLVKRTLRSGQKVNYQGNVIIMGDVNPGAEVIAGGDIIVLGSLRGVAHAGATGNDLASVFALKLLPTQLRIANFIARPPDGDVRVPNAPEVANVKDSRVVIEIYNYR